MDMSEQKPSMFIFAGNNGSGNYLTLMDELVVIDNSALDGAVILQVSHGRLEYRNNSIPAWVMPIYNKLYTE